jgi:hypothetical protein
MGRQALIQFGISFEIAEEHDGLLSLAPDIYRTHNFLRILRRKHVKENRLENLFLLVQLILRLPNLANLNLVPHMVGKNEEESRKQADEVKPNRRVRHKFAGIESFDVAENNYGNCRGRCHNNVHGSSSDLQVKPSPRGIVKVNMHKNGIIGTIRKCSSDSSTHES